MSSDLHSSHEPTLGRSAGRSRLLGHLPRPQFRVGAVVVLVVAALVLAVLVSLLGSGGAVQTIDGAELSGRSEEGSSPPTTAGAQAGVDDLYVHVLGAVVAPGLYRVSDGARAFDAIAAAGGMLPEADPAGVNLARFVSDGEQLVVPVVGEVPGAVGGAAGDGTTSGTGAGGQLVNLNTATAAELATLPRIGEALAARIIAWREANGRFTSVDDLSAVEGIGTKTLDGLRDSATV